MDYEKAYKDALERARNYYKGLAPCRAKDELELIFHELAESEDERIRKELYAVINDLILPDDQKARFNGWLEKQKINTEGDFGRGYDCGYQAGYAVATNEMKPKVATATLATLETEKQKEQEHPCDSAQFEEGFKTGLEIGLRKQKEQKPAEWEDIKDKVNVPYCSSEQEWSEEDEEIFNNIIEKAKGGHWIEVNEITWLINRFKSLRPPKDCSGCSKHLEGYISGRGDAENKLLEMYGILLMPDGELRMKPRWKPSEEQMEALERASTNKYLSAKQFDILVSLYEQLKKL